MSSLSSDGAHAPRPRPPDWEPLRGRASWRPLGPSPRVARAMAARTLPTPPTEQGLARHLSALFGFRSPDLSARRRCVWEPPAGSGHHHVRLSAFAWKHPADVALGPRSAKQAGGGPWSRLPGVWLGTAPPGTPEPPGRAATPPPPPGRPWGRAGRAGCRWLGSLGARRPTPPCPPLPGTGAGPPVGSEGPGPFRRVSLPGSRSPGGAGGSPREGRAGTAPSSPGSLSSRVLVCSLQRPRLRGRLRLVGAPWTFLTQRERRDHGRPPRPEHAVSSVASHRPPAGGAALVSEGGGREGISSFCLWLREPSFWSPSVTRSLFLLWLLWSPRRHWATLACARASS